MIQLWDANGNIILNTNDRIGKFSGSIAVAANTSGSLTVPDTGTVFAFSVPNAVDTSAAELYFDGMTISWNYYQSGSYRNPSGDCIIYYGVY